MKKTILFGLLITFLIIISGCSQENITGNVVKEKITEYVCPNGSTVVNKEDCPKIETKPICNDECSTDICEGVIYFACLMQEDGCKDKIRQDKVLNKCGVECLSIDNCKSDEQCSGNYKCEKKKEKPKITSSEYDIKAPSTNTPSLSDALKDLQKSLEDSSRTTSKINECTKLCAGDSYNIPVVKNECYLSCYQTYYYGGEGTLDELIEIELKAMQGIAESLGL